MTNINYVSSYVVHDHIDIVVSGKSDGKIHTQDSLEIRMPMKPLASQGLAALICFVSSVNAGAVSDVAYSVSIQDDYGTVQSVIRDEIINQGLVVDFIGDVGAMLKRTGDDIGENSPYLKANYYLFCSAKNTHAAVAAHPMNIALCPYTVFSYELKRSPGEIVIGYRRPVGMGGAASEKAAREIEELLKSVVHRVAQ